jgi:hypothetical protein
MNEYTERLKGKIVSDVEKTEGCLKIHFSDGTILESISRSEDLDYSSDIILDIMEPRISNSLNETFGSSNGAPAKETIKKEPIQLLDVVSYDKQKAFVIGQLGCGDYIIELSKNGQTIQVKEDQIKLLVGKAPGSIQQFKFDKETQKVLFEQWVKCGVYMNNVPVKTNNCFVQYSDWVEAKDSENINVLIEGTINLFPKSNIQLFEDVNDFANINDLVSGTIPDYEDSLGNGRRKVWVKLNQKQNAIGGADEIFVIDMKTNKSMTVPAHEVEITQELNINAQDMLDNLS